MKLRSIHSPLARKAAAMACLLAMATPGSAKAEDSPSAPPAEPRSSPGRAALAAGAAVVPGVLVHGAGHFVVGDGRTGSKLLILETVGLGAMAVGFIPIVLSGASRRLVGPAAALTVAGAGLFAISALADLYGVLAPAGGTGAPSRISPLVQTELGFRYVYNPVFTYRDFVVYGVDYRPGRWRAHPSAWFAADQSTSRVRVPLGYRLMGPISLRVPFFATIGNHELGTDDGQPFQRMVGRASFRFFYGGLELIFLDSGSATLDPRVYAWLDGWLAEGAGRTRVALMHIPPMDPVGLRNGSFADRNEAAKVLAKLAEGGVDLTLYGHIHTFMAFANAGIPAYISGGGGAIPERFDGIGRHYLTVDVDPKGGVLQTGLVRIDGD